MPALVPIRFGSSPEGTPKRPLVSGQTGVPPVVYNTVLLLNMTGANGSVIFTDESPAAHGNANVVGSAAISTAQAPPNGTGSYHGTADGDDLNYDDSPDWVLALSNSDEYTIEVFFRTALTNNGDKFLFEYGKLLSSPGWALWINQSGNGELQFLWSADGMVTQNLTTSGLTWIANTWYYVAVTKDATGKIRIYLGAVTDPLALVVASSTPVDSAIASTGVELTIFAQNLANRSLVGFGGAVRLTKGQARYVSDVGCLIPTVPLAA